MYLNNLVVAIKTTGGKTLREASVQTLSSNNYPYNSTRSGVVYLPFDSEYSIFLKNTSNCRCAVEVSIDGTDVLGGHRLVIQPNDTMDLERFILDGDLRKGRRFKFISKDHPDVQNPGSSENGFITIKAQWEKYPPIIFSPITTWGWYTPFSVHPNVTGNIPFTPMPRDNTPYIGDPLPGQEPWTVCNASNQGYKPRSIHINAMYCNTDSFSAGNLEPSYQSAPVPTAGQVGATVEGSQSYQSFGTTTLGEMNPQIVTIRFQMLAPKNDTPYTAKETKEKYCHQCGRQLLGRFNYCPICGAKQQYLV